MKRTSLLALAITLGSLGIARAEVSVYAIEPTHTSTMFEIGHMGTSTNRGRFDKTEGTVQLDKAARTGKLDVTVYTGSLYTGLPAFTKHISSEEMLDVEQFPTAHFVSEKFTFVGDKVSEVSGVLTLKGKSNPVVLKARNFNCYQKAQIKREICGGDFDTDFPRTEYGIDYALNYGVPDTVHLVIQVEAVKQ